jgi:hypothetical protein
LLTTHVTVTITLPHRHHLALFVATLIICHMLLLFIIARCCAHLHSPPFDTPVANVDVHMDESLALYYLYHYCRSCWPSIWKLPRILVDS